jgi:hypothetical protein
MSGEKIVKEENDKLRDLQQKGFGRYEATLRIERGIDWSRYRPA